MIHAMEHGEHHVHEHHHEHDEHDEHHYHDETEPHHFDPQDMMNMGGLRYKIPVTFYAFVAGGISLAGIPLITAGFWSKDEILADAWLGLTHGYGPPALVFIMLALAAFLTAFYTSRQIGLTFAGQPRTEEAEHAGLGGPRSIISRTMQLPLIILIPFALFAGFVGVPPEFPIFGAIFSPDGNPFFDFVKYTVLEAFQPEKPPFSWWPVLTSFGVALGGWYLGWLLYWREPVKAGEEDPIKRILPESIYNTLMNRYYLDDLYKMVFVQPSQWFSRVVVSEFIDRGIIDGFIHLIARLANWIGDLLKLLNLWLIDGVGDGIPQGIVRFGVWLRRVQTGRVQQYLILAIMAALLIGLIFVVSTTVAAN
ncbi:MAG: hypothetical protein Kow00117_16110 [Phototrophicales bacterium]